jgi:YidC/Oxa1 family membrane protein insertase
MNAMFDKVLAPLEWVVAWLMVNFHRLFTAIGLPEASGFTWGLSIVGLVIVIRIVLIPLFVKQIHASRRMQLIQPEMQKIQKKYKGKTDPESRQAMTQETMGLYKRTGTNPFSSCLPILLQSPVFFALFRVLNNLAAIASGKHATIGPLDANLAHQAQISTIFGAPLSSHFLGSTDTSTKLVTVVLIILMSASTFTTQRQLMMKNMPANAMDNPFAKQQKVLLYLMPLFFAFSGINFPIGVLLYWLTTNLWSMGQQFYTIRRMPAPGSPAEKALEERRLKSGKEHKKFSIPGLTHDEAEPVQDTPIQDTKPKSGQRQQPKRKNRARPTAQGEAGAGATPPPAAANGGSTSGKPPATTAGTPKDVSQQGVSPATAAGTPKDVSQEGVSPAAANGGPTGLKPPTRTGRNRNRKGGVKPPAAANGKSPEVKPSTTSDGSANGVTAPRTTDRAPNGVKPSKATDGNNTGVKPPVTEH